MDFYDSVGNCYGENSYQYSDTLKEFINDELRDSYYYAVLASRSRNREQARIFRKFSSDEKRHAKRFSIANYLITGENYFPNISELPPVVVPTFSEALRERYLAESRDSVKYPRFASEVQDPCLSELAIEAGNDEREHASIIYSMIENLY